MKKRILSVFIAILFVMNCFHLSVIAEFEENIDLIEVFLENDFADDINVDDKEYDGELTAAVDCKNVKLINAHEKFELEMFDNVLIRKLIECVKVMSKTEILVIFKGGYEVKAEIEQ